jgi:hypothetical protein
MQYKCPQCGITYSRRASLKNHIKTHSRSDIDRILEQIREQDVQQAGEEVISTRQNEPVESENIMVYETQESINVEEEEFVNSDEKSINVEEKEFVNSDEESINVEEEEFVNTNEEMIDVEEEKFINYDKVMVNVEEIDVDEKLINIEEEEEEENEEEPKENEENEESEEEKEEELLIDDDVQVRFSLNKLY